jgi:hypothetical protein
VNLEPAAAEVTTVPMEKTRPTMMTTKMTVNSLRRGKTIRDSRLLLLVVGRPRPPAVEHNHPSPTPALQDAA